MTTVASRVTDLLIDGELVPARGGTFTTINPATEEPLGEAADADRTDMDRAIGAARAAFDEMVSRYRSARPVPVVRRGTVDHRTDLQRRRRPDHPILKGMVR